jgi:predicted PurR-regulated permease PerM
MNWKIILLILVLVVAFFVIIYAVIEEKFINTCQNIPPMFKKRYSKIPNEFRYGNLKSLPLGANETMVFGKNVGSCSSNINGVNVTNGTQMINEDAEYCTY